MSSLSDDGVRALYKLFADRFSYDELEDLAFLMGIRFDDIPGETRNAKARVLADYIARRELVDRLRQVGQRERPEIAWADVLGGEPPAAPTPPPRPPTPGGVPDLELGLLSLAVAGLIDFAEPVDRRNMLKAAGVALFVDGIDLVGAPRPVALRVLTQLNDVSKPADNRTPLGDFLRYVLKLPEASPHKDLLERTILNNGL